MISAGLKLPLKRFDAAMLRGATAHYLIDLTYAGRVFRLSREVVGVPIAATGEVLQYEGTLEGALTWEEALTLFSSSGDVSSVSLACVLPVDVPALVAAGHDLLSATGELSMWIEGTDYEDRRVLMRGRLADPQYGGVDEPISASLQAEWFEDSAIIPAPSQVVSATTWPSAAENAVGMSYPLVFGATAASGAGATSMSRAYLVDTAAEYILIAGHRVLATSVNISVEGDLATGTVITSTDALGQVVSLVDLTGLPLTYDDTDDFMVSWTSGALAGDDGEVLTGAGDVLAYLLRLSSVPVDTGRVQAAKAYLNRFKLAGCVLEGVSPFEFISANLSPILPMSMVLGPYGLYPVPWRFDAILRDAVEHIDREADPTIDRDGPVQYETSIKDIVNEFKLRWALRLRTGSTRGMSVLTGSRNEDNPDEAESVYCYQSQARYGVKAMDVETTLVYDAATAGLVLAWWARAKSLPTRTITYVVGYDRAWLERGDPVAITDPELHMDQQMALVEQLTYREDGTIRLRLRVVEDVALTFKAAG